MCQLIYHIFNDIAIYFVLVLKGVNPFPTKQKRLFQENSSFFVQSHAKFSSNALRITADVCCTQAGHELIVYFIHRKSLW